MGGGGEKAHFSTLISAVLSAPSPCRRPPIPPPFWVPGPPSSSFLPIEQEHRAGEEEEEERCNRVKSQSVERASLHRSRRHLSQSRRICLQQLLPPSPLPPHGARLPFWLAEIAGGESSPPPPPHVCACGAFATGAEGGDGEAEIIHQCLNFIVVHWRAVLSSCYMAYYHNDAGKTGV